MMRKIRISLHDYEGVERDFHEISFQEPVDGSLPKKVSRIIVEFMHSASKVAGHVEVKHIPTW